VLQARARRRLLCAVNTGEYNRRAVVVLERLFRAVDQYHDDLLSRAELFRVFRAVERDRARLMNDKTLFKSK